MPEAKETVRCEDAAEARYGAGALMRELARQRVRPVLAQAAAGPFAACAVLRVSVRAVLASEPACAGLLAAVIALTRAQQPLTLSLTDLGREACATDNLEAFCRLLAAGLAAEGLAADGLATSVHSHALPLHAYGVICGALLGGGRRYVMLDALQLRHQEAARARREAERNWAVLWQRRAAPPRLVPAYAAAVTTRCPLLGDEAALAVLPASGLQVPMGSAWLPLEVNLTDFSDGRGRLDGACLEQCLRRAAELADRLLDMLRWPLPGLAADARLNRRLAFCLGGIGDLVTERGADPADLGCLEWIDGVVADVHAALWRGTRERAAAAGPLPALLESDPAAAAVCDAHRLAWRQRWRAALATAGVRNRNLLALSPAAVLPAEGDGGRFADLLPVLRHADVFRFAPEPARSFADCTQFIRFHRRAWAVIRRRNAASLVAAGA